MKTKFLVTLCISLVLGLVSNASAQLVAGSPEDSAYGKILDEANPDAKATMLLDFEKQYPQSKVMTDVYIMLMSIYQQKNDTVKAVDFGERVIKIDANNVTALLAVARNYSLERKNLDRAVQYSQQALDTVEKMKKQPAPPQYTEQQWKDYIDSNEQVAKTMLAYAKSLKP